MDKESFVKKFLTWLFIKPKNVDRYYDPEVNPVNTDKIYKDLLIDVKAKELGSAEQPNSKDLSLSGVERQIIQRVDKARTDYFVWATSKLCAINQQVSKVDISVLINKANQANQEFERKASEVLSDSETLIRKLSDHSKSRLNELEQFKCENELTRLAICPSDTALLLKTGLLILLICVESGLNAFLFAKGVSSGYIGGFVYALIFASANVLVYFFNGLVLFRYFNHKKIILKLIGFLSVFIWMVTSLPVALLTAHFRDVLSKDVIDASSLAMQTLVDAPFGLSDAKSWMLFFISIFFGIIAFVDGYSFKDRYPGYSDAEKRARHALDEFYQEIDYIREKLKELKDEALEEIEFALKTSKSEIEILKEIIESKKALKAKIEFTLPDIENCLCFLLNNHRLKPVGLNNGLKVRIRVA